MARPDIPVRDLYGICDREPRDVLHTKFSGCVNWRAAEDGRNPGNEPGNESEKP